MFFHNLKYTLKTLLKNKSLLFWTIFFPFILATLFNMAFGNWTESEKFDPINIAIIDNSNYYNNEVAKTIFSSISKTDQNQVFNIEYTTIKEASELLANKEIVAYIEYNENLPTVTIESNSFKATIVKSVVDEINTYNIMFNDLLNKDIVNTVDTNQLITNIINKISNIEIKTKDISLNKLDISLIEYYSLIAMTSLYGGFIALVCISNCLASTTNQGKRVEVSPVEKRTIVFSSLTASFIVQISGILLLLGYYQLLGINLQVDLLGLIIISIFGVLSGIALGLLVCAISNKNLDAKFGIIIAISMACTVLAGLTGVSLKYLIDTKIPFLNMINPAAMMTDGLYSLYYNDINRYLFNILSLGLFVIIMIIISIYSLRRKKYDNI